LKLSVSLALDFAPAVPRRGGLKLIDVNLITLRLAATSVRISKLFIKLRITARFMLRSSSGEN
jgi:hypothetical protein